MSKKKKEKEEVMGTAVDTLLRTPISLIGMPGFKSQLHFVSPANEYLKCSRG